MEKRIIFIYIYTYTGNQHIYKILIYKIYIKYIYIIHLYTIPIQKRDRCTDSWCHLPPKVSTYKVSFRKWLLSILVSLCLSEYAHKSVDWQEWQPAPTSALPHCCFHSPPWDFRCCWQQQQYHLYMWNRNKYH